MDLLGSCIPTLTLLLSIGDSLGYLPIGTSVGRQAPTTKDRRLLTGWLASCTPLVRFVSGMVSSATPPPPSPAATAAAGAADDEVTDLSKKYDTPMGLAHDTMQALKDRIKLHYDLASDYYLNLWYVLPPL